VSGALLELGTVSKTFGGLKAVSQVSFAVPTGQIFGLIGPNGAGKTTIFNVVTGVYPPDAGGTVRLGGQSLHHLKPFQIAARGIARTFQNIRVFGQMSVVENVLVSAHLSSRVGVWGTILRSATHHREEKERHDRALRLLEIFGLEDLAGEQARSLPYGSQRRLEIARALMLSPKVLLLDEPAAGMNPSETHEITQLIGKLREEGGYTILLIEHDMHVVEGISDRVVALDHGVKIAEGSFEAVATDPKVIEAYLGLGAAARK